MSEESKKTETEGRNSEDSWKSDKEVEQKQLIDGRQGEEIQEIENRYEDVIIREFRGRGIKIYGTTEEPLFKANEIGEVLQLQKIKKTIKGYGIKERKELKWEGEKEKEWYLTEVGIQKLIMRQSSKKGSLAEELQEWVIEVIKEIRLEGQKQLQEMYEQKEYIRVQTEEIYRKENKILREVNEKYRRQIEQQERSYEEKEYKRRVKIYRKGWKEEGEIYQVGEQENEQMRSGQQKHRREESECGSKDMEQNEVYRKDCIDEKICECVIKSILEKQGYEIQMNRRVYYKCKLEHIIRMVECVCDMINVLMQCRQKIEEEELEERVRKEMEKRQSKNMKKEIKGWLKKRIRYKENMIILCEDIRQKLNEQLGYKKEIEMRMLKKYVKEYIEEEYESVEIKTLKMSGLGEEEVVINVELVQNVQ